MTELLLKEHQERVDKGLMALPNSVQTDMGNIAFMKSDLKTLVPPNPFDMSGKKVALQRTAAGDFTMKVTPGTVSATQGTPIALGDDASKQVAFNSGFSFPFFGTTYTSVFVNSDGNLTFKSGDNASTPRDTFRFLIGPPRLAPFFQDMNPSVRGKINVLQSASKFTVTWNDVTEYLNSGSNSNTFQINLFKNGNVEFIYGSLASTEAIVGISPGNASVASLKIVNYSTVSTLTGIKGPLMERFVKLLTMDIVAIINEFNAAHAKEFDFVVVFTDFPVALAPGAFAYFSHVQNQIKGIGLPVFNFSNQFGSQELQGFLAMGSLARFPDDPNKKFLGENTTMGIMGQENGHRWLSFPKVRVNGVNTNDLLGRDDAHWNFYMDTDSSVMEGNDIRDNGNGTFTTVNAVSTYSKLDQYIMGLVPPTSVPPFFFVNGDFTDQGRSPQIGVLFRGTRVNVSISQVIQANGPRVPSSTTSPKTFREAFILFSKASAPRQVDLNKVNLIRNTWQSFFHAQTGNRGTLDTTLAP